MGGIRGAQEALIAGDEVGAHLIRIQRSGLYVRDLGQVHAKGWEAFAEFPPNPWSLTWKNAVQLAYVTHYHDRRLFSPCFYLMMSLKKEELVWETAQSSRGPRTAFFLYPPSTAFLPHVFLPLPCPALLLFLPVSLSLFFLPACPFAPFPIHLRAHSRRASPHPSFRRQIEFPS